MTERELIDSINELRQQRDAVILAHNYELDEVQAIADFAGDSLELSRKAATVDAKVVVFCGVHFMAETAAVLSPEKTVLLPARDAGCPMADMITGGQLRALKAEHPDAAVICYVNSSAEVKAESDCCCTSANALEVAKAFAHAPEIIFVPDKNLGGHVASLLGRTFIPWEGYCHVHQLMTADDVHKARKAHPNAPVMVHPECAPDIRALADHILSTGQMCRFAQADDARQYIVGTEIGILYRLETENPEKSFFPVSTKAVCEDMKKITLENVHAALRDMKHRITVPDEIAKRAKHAITRMIELG